MEKEEVILSFKGDITKDLLSSIYQIIENRLEHDAEDQKRKKKFYHVLVECLQNMYHHMESLKEIPNEGGKQAASAIFTICRSNDGGYKILTGNFILTENVEGLKERIEYINNLDPVSLKAYYLEKLNSNELSDKGGAGLGIIDIARKSGNRIEYDFEEVNTPYSFFTLAAKIN